MIFMTISAITLCCLALVIMVSCGRSSKTKDAETTKYRGYDDFPIKRGINISHWLSQSRRRGAERDAFFTRDDVKLIASLGFDHIRLPIDEEQMWDEAGNKEPRAFELMHNAIVWAMEEGLRVIVDLHIIRSHYFNAAENLLWTSNDEQQKFIGLWRELSYELSKYPCDIVAYELMNEPVAPDPSAWNNLVALTLKAVRENEAGRKIVIGSNMWQSVNTFKDLVIPDEDPNIILSFHFYEPFLLTHHQASWTPIGKYTGPVQYPGLTIDPADIDPLLPEDIKASLVHHNKVYTRDSLAALINQPLQFALKYNLPLYCGEWGCLPTMDDQTRLRWYADVRSILEENQIAWTKWDYKGSFGIVDGATGEKKEALLKVLLD